MKKTVIIIGDDKLGRSALKHLRSIFPDLPVYLNRSASWRRLLRLLRKNPAFLRDLVPMVLAEWRRHDTEIPETPVIANSREMFEMIAKEAPDTVLCFRAGIILGPKLLASGPRFLNLHYADLPEWGGLGALPRALRAGAYAQNACLHEIVPKIDAGPVLRRAAYRLDPALSYRENEENGFRTGLSLLESFFKETLR